MSLKSYAFTSESRLTEKAGYKEVFNRPIYTRKNQFFSIFAAKSNREQPRLGIVVAKRNVKLAVARNKLKRLIRESFRLQKASLAGLDVVVVVKRDFAFEASQGQQPAVCFGGLGSKNSKWA